MGDLSVCVEMLVRKPSKDVFKAFSLPRMLEKFWLKHASGPLTMGAIVEWEFLVEGAQETVTVTNFQHDKVIEFEWSDGVAVSIDVKPHDQIGSRVSIAATGFKDSSQKADAIQGFTIVLCDLKSLLETGHSGNMVRDKAALITTEIAKA